MLNQKDFSKPLLDKTEHYEIIFNLIEKCEKKCSKSLKLELRGLYEVNNIIEDIINSFSDLIQGKSKIYNHNQDFDKYENNKDLSTTNKTDSAHFLVIKLENFCQFVKEKIYTQLNKALSVEQVNKRLIDSDDEDYSENNYSQNNELTDRIKLLRNTLKKIEQLENQILDATNPKKGASNYLKTLPQKQRDNYSIILDPEDVDNPNSQSLNKEYRSLNKFIGFFCLICVVGSLGIFVVFAWKNLIIDN